MQTCYNCGKSVPDGTLICPDCGALVRRYTTPANPTAQQPAQQPVRPVQPIQPISQQPVRPVAPDKVRLRGPVKVWLIILCVISGYMAFSSLCAALLGSNPQVMEQMLSESGMGNASYLLSTMREMFPAAVPLFFLLCALFAAKFGCHLWLLLSARRLAFYVSIAVSLLSLLAMFLPVGSWAFILYFLDPLITWLGLWSFWKRMPK